MYLSENLLPEHVIARATLRGNEYAWPVEDIPMVIEAAKAASLISLGGQLQFRISEGRTCECYWVEVDPSNDVRADLLWAERVSATATAALSQFKKLCDERDFVTEGRSAFGALLAEFEAGGGSIHEALCFVWYVESENGAAAHQV